MRNYVIERRFPFFGKRKRSSENTLKVGVLNRGAARKSGKRRHITRISSNSRSNSFVKKKPKRYSITNSSNS